MKQTTALDLSSLDGHLLDGLEFCRAAYDLFDQIRDGPDGIKKLRLRPTKIEKRLVEELLPIARYVQARYREGRRIKVRWMSGSQPYDAVIWSSGAIVSHRMAPRKVLLEVTSSMHENEHLARRLLHERGGSFGVKGISRDTRTGAIISQPYVHCGNEIERDLAAQIIERLESKARKNYPPSTVLVIQCVANSLTLENEWAAVVERVRASGKYLPFREVFLFEHLSLISATLWGQPKRRH